MKKALSLFLVALFLLSAVVFSFAGCGLLKSMTPDPALVEVTDLMFTEEGASQSFEYAPPVTGRYFLFLKSAESGFRIRISVSDAQGENLGTEYAQRGDGLTVNLEAGARYNVEVAQSHEIGSFTFGIGVPREWTGPGKAGRRSASP